VSGGEKFEKIVNKSCRTESRKTETRIPGRSPRNFTPRASRADSSPGEDRGRGPFFPVFGLRASVFGVSSDDVARPGRDSVPWKDEPIECWRDAMSSKIKKADADSAESLNAWRVAQQQLRNVAELLRLDEDLFRILSTPRLCMTVPVPIRHDDGRIRV